MGKRNNYSKRILAFIMAGVFFYGALGAYVVHTCCEHCFIDEYALVAETHEHDNTLGCCCSEAAACHENDEENETSQAH